MIDNTGTPFNAISGEKHLGIIPSMANRHGLIAGATGLVFDTAISRTPSARVERTLVRFSLIIMFL